MIASILSSVKLSLPAIRFLARFLAIGVRGTARFVLSALPWAVEYVRLTHPAPPAEPVPPARPASAFSAIPWPLVTLCALAAFGAGLACGIYDAHRVPEEKSRA